MYWYAHEPLFTADMSRAFNLAMAAPGDRLLNLSVRRLAALGTPESIQLLVDSVGREPQIGRQIGILQGLNASLIGRRHVDPPSTWNDVYAKLKSVDNPHFKSQLKTLAVTFGDPGALAELRDVLRDTKADTPRRGEAMASLLAAKDKQLPEILVELLKEPALRAGAIRGLALYEHPQAVAPILAIYNTLPPAERSDALATLCAQLLRQAVIDCHRGQQDPVQGTLGRLRPAFAQFPRSGNRQATQRRVG